MTAQIDDLLDDVTTETAGRRNRGLFRSPGPGFHVGWYPVMLSQDLTAGTVHGIDLCDGRIALYRGADGVARAMTPYCKHMGADLSVGDVIDNDLRCPFHHWQFGPDGVCSKIPTGDRIPKVAFQRTFTVEDRWGIIWVWWGNGDPLYDVPGFAEWDDEEWVSLSYQVPLNEPLLVEPWVFTTNAVDFAHFRSVHGVPDLNPEIEQDDWSMVWTAPFPHPTVGKMTMTLKLVGMNAVVSHSDRAGDILTHIATTAPLGESGVQFFVTVATRRGENAQAALEAQQDLHTQLINEDLPVMNSIRLGDATLVGSDYGLVSFLRRMREFPRVTFPEIEYPS